MTTGIVSCTGSTDFPFVSLSRTVAPCFNGRLVCFALLFGSTLFYLVFACQS